MNKDTTVIVIPGLLAGLMIGLLAVLLDVPLQTGIPYAVGTGVVFAGCWVMMRVSHNIPEPWRSYLADEDPPPKR